MNILEIIDRNTFLKKLYPKGLFNFYIGKIELTTMDKLTIILHHREKPQINIPKWGEWDKDYNTITSELIGNSIKNIEIINWQNNNNEICICNISKIENGYFLLIFEGNNWYIKIELASLVFQKNTVYFNL